MNHMRKKRILEKVASHSRGKCMRCASPPTREFKWAEGRAHAWFCDAHARKFRGEHGPDSEMGADIDAERAVTGGAVGKKFGGAK